MASKSDKYRELMGQFQEEKQNRTPSAGKPAPATGGSKADRYRQLMGQWENEKTVREKSAQQTVTGGILGAVPGAKMVSMFPEYPELLKQRDDQQTRLEQLRKAQEDLYTLEGPYGYLANDTVSPEKRAEYQARYDEILNQYGKDATSDSLREQMEQLEGELNASRDRITGEKNWTAYSAMTPEEQLAFRRYAEAMSGGAVSFGSDGKIRSPLLEIQGEPEIQAIISKYGKGRVEEIAETLKRDMNRALAEEANALGREIGESLGLGAIPLGVGTGILGTPANLLGLANEAITGTGQYSTADPYHAGGALSNLSQGIGAGGAKKAPEQMVNLLEMLAQANPYNNEMGTTGNYRPQLYEATRGTKAGEVIDAVGEGAYLIVNTAADSLTRAYMGGGIFGAGTTGAKAFSLGLAGARSFADTFNDVSAKGGTPTQAAVLGVFNAGTEIATEYIPLEEWWKVAENGSDSVKAMLKAAAKQGAMEMTQEEIGFLATTMAEYAVLREKSEFQVLKRDLMASGMTEEQAERAIWEEFGRQAAGVAVTSFFSGALSEAGAEAYRSLMPGTIANEDASPAGAADSPLREGATSSVTADAVPPSPGGKALGDVSEAGTVPKAQTPLAKAQDYYRQNGTISNSMAEAILADNEALTELTRLTPVKLDGTKSQNRAEIRAAVARISGEAELSAEGQVQTMADAVGDAELRQTEQVAPEQEREADMPGAVAAAMRGEAYAAAESLADQALPSQSPAATALPEGEPRGSLEAEQQTRPEEAEGRMPAMGAADLGFTRDFAPEMADSKVYTNTYANATDPGVKASGEAAVKEAPDIGKYEKRTEKDSLSAAEARTRTDEDIQAEYELLIREPNWSGEDNDTAMIVLKRLLEKGEINQHRNLSRKQREQGTNAGQLVQSFAKYSRMDAMTAASEGLSALYDMSRGDVDKRYWGKADGKTDAEKFENWVADIGKKVSEIGATIDQVKDGDIATVRKIVRELAQFRRTTAWLGMSNNLTRAADKGVDRLDFETLKTVAKAQLGQIPNDYKKVSVGQVIKSLATMNMLSSLVTVNRNLAGNSTTGLMDALSDSSSGRLADIVLSKFTGQRTVGNDIKHGKEYFRGAWDAACMASLFTELAIPMDNAAYTDPTRTFSPQGNLLTRFLSGCEMGLKYALEVTDKFYEGGAQASVAASLKDMGPKSGLTGEQAQNVAAATGARRTYKDNRALAKATGGVKAAMNYVGTEDVGAGDVFIPFAKAPANVVHVGIDYSAGVVEGLGQMIKIAKDAKAGKTIDPVAQRAAATNFGRGVSGAAMIAMFTALAAKGAIKVFNDKDRDKAALEQSLGYDDAVWNLSASWRLLTGKDGAWKPDDIKINLGFLQPFNSQMYIGAELAKEDSFWGMVKKLPGATVSGIAQSIMDIPMFQTFEDVVDIFKSFGEVGEDQNAVMDATGKLVGNVGTRAIPSWLRQTAQYIDPNYRDTSADSTLGKAWNQIVAAIPGASKTLPMKYDGFGNPQLRYDDKVLGFFNTFISPGKFMGATAPESAYDMAAYLEQLTEITGDKTMYPDYAAPKSFSMDGERVELSKEQQSEYQRVYGENISDLYGQLMADEAFRKLPAEKQIEVLKSAKMLADDYAKAHTVGEGETSPGNLRETVGGLINSRISKDIGGAFDDLSETGYTGAAAQDAIGQMEAALDIYEGLSKDQKKAFLEGNSGRVASLIRATEKGMSVATFAELYGHYKDIEGNGEDETAQADEWGAYLYQQQEKGRITSAQVAQLREDFIIWRQIPTDPDKLDQMVESGDMKSGKALRTINLIDGLVPNEGAKEVSDLQKAVALAESGWLNDRELTAALYAYMPKEQDENLTQMLDKGYSPQDYVTAYEITRQNKKDAIADLRREFGLSENAAKALYAIFKAN